MVLARWTAHPAKSRPRDLALFCAVLCLTAGAVLASLQSVLLTALAVLIIVVSLAPFLFPTTYQLTDQGVEERRLWSTKSRTWTDLRRVQVGAGAALVSPFANPTWLDRYRGMILYFDGCDRDQVVDILRTRVSEAAESEAEPA